MFIRRKKGFVNMFFLGAVIILLFTTMVFTGEAGRMRLKRHELELMLKLDYQAESCYLLLKSGEMDVPEEALFLDSAGVPLMGSASRDAYIKIRNEAGCITVIPFYKGRERGYYEIRQ